MSCRGLCWLPVLRSMGRLSAATSAILFVPFFAWASTDGGRLVEASPDGGEPNWTHFRGPDLDGVAMAKGLPVAWDDTTNVEWKTEIKGHGWSSPVVFGNHVWCTSARPDGSGLYAVCIDLDTGETRHRILAFEPPELYRKHTVNTYATPTPAIENGRVYVSFGRYGTAAIDTGLGDVLWKRTDLHCKDVQGPGASVLLHKDLLIVHMEGVDVRYIVALDKHSGDTVWKVDRPEGPYEGMMPIGKKAYVTPCLVEVGGRDLMISNGSGATIAYEPQTGKEVWRILTRGESNVSMPTVSDGVVYFYAGYEINGHDERYSELMAVNPDGKGDIAATHILWKVKAPAGQLLTPVVKDGLVYTVDATSKLQCLDAESGEILFTERLRGKYHSSPIWADGHVYFSSTQGDTRVIQAGREFKPVAENKLDGEIWATPAIVDHALLVRTSKYLYKIKQTSIQE